MKPMVWGGKKLVAMLGKIWLFKQCSRTPKRKWGMWHKRWNIIREKYPFIRALKENPRYKYRPMTMGLRCVAHKD
jgi:hypothetical protein